ncbi:hypothetical protein GYMLUDRAFT_375354 [Collybiopsis luxurians FD-317 M1]|uniref:Uncharacterized protein n=1 Tax=Collybiopsis luxurians FD-317 M1 TaxID=944289 RepID=A0A0D0CB09_9AGAR|nr:hypothetical protein GYMLUDRAFT_375354 [Collybiopsis luxurians FD-317 M1]
MQHRHLNKFRIYDEFDQDCSVCLCSVFVFSEQDYLTNLAKASAGDWITCVQGQRLCRRWKLDPGESVWVQSEEFEASNDPTLCTRRRIDESIPNEVGLGGDVGRIALWTDIEDRCIHKRKVLLWT